MKKIGRHEQKELTRKSLVLKAEELFSRQGIAATTTADIAKALGLSHGALFVHFATREDLLQVVVEEFGNRLANALGERCDQNLKLKDFLKNHLSVLSQFEDFYLRLISESVSLPPHIRSTVYAMNASLSYRLYRSAKPLIDSGEIKKLSQSQLFNTWMGHLNYQIMNRDLFSDSTPILQHRSNDILSHFLNLISVT